MSRSIVSFVLIFIAVPLWAFSEPAAASKADVAEPDVEFLLKKMHELIVETEIDKDIPTAIILGQLYIESKFGASELAKKANNYFGIKCGSNWNGEIYRKNDDCGDTTCHFRKYATAKESFLDYARFLKKPRYAMLFELSYHDYKGWANGLKDASYATNPKYAEELIACIEKFQLTRFNRYKLPGKVSEKKTFTKVPAFVMVEPGDAIVEIGRRYGIEAGSLADWNEVQVTSVIARPSKIWLCPKFNHLRRCPHFFLVTHPITLYDISQIVGVRVSVLLKMNPQIAHRDELLKKWQCVHLRP